MILAWLQYVDYFPLISDVLSARVQRPVGVCGQEDSERNSTIPAHQGLNFAAGGLTIDRFAWDFCNDMMSVAGLRNQ